MSLLSQFGWNTFHSHSITYTLKPGECYGRVITIKGHAYTAITERGELNCELSGKLLFSTDAEQRPCVGDWVTFLDYADTGIITSVLGRRNALTRKRPGGSSEKQVLAANVDGALIVQSLDTNFNLMRLERYIVQVLACGIDPIVVLNKSDLAANPDDFRERVLALGRSVPIILCSTRTEDGLAAIQKTLKPDCTYILIGSSGVGKSSLLNALLHSDVRTTGGLSESTWKGRHTTTTRDLFRLPGGSLIIDTPGMREFGVTYEEHQSNDLFPAIARLADQCRYGDCLHLDEPGCAVTAALHDGALERETYQSYVKLMKEQQRFQIRASDKKRMNRQFGKITREARAHRKRYKF